MSTIEEISELLKRKKLRIAVAESCTGGSVSNAFTNIPGASKFFIAGVVAYSDFAKINILGVPPEIIVKHGAVSADVAKEMCIGVKKLTGADIGLSVTGYASGGEGIPEVMVGLVYMGIHFRDLIVFERRFSGQRNEIKTTITEHISEKLLEIIKKDL
ncbi:MAG: CinA family protein [Thermoplasmata archaeon]